MIYPIRTVLILVLLFTQVSCKNQAAPPKVQHGFYFWKSAQYQLTEKEDSILKHTQCQKLYVKFFDVEKDPLFFAKPISKSELHFWDYNNDYQMKKDSNFCKMMTNMEIIPTVFIKNEVFRSASKGSMDTLADNINFLINKHYAENFKYQQNYKEIQIDCDWTAKTKDNYFYLLKNLKSLSKKTISCTLRLYPYKYTSAMGIPPVDKATLMCYNLISSLDNENKNAILDNKELESYLKNVSKYPLPLDIALPVFSWMLVFQNNSFAGMINPEEGELKDALKLIKPLWYEVHKDVVIGSLYLREGDKIKYEEVSEKTIDDAIVILKKHVSLDDDATITLFHLDDKNLSKYTYETLTSFYTDFSK